MNKAFLLLHLTPASTSTTELMRENTKCGEAEPLWPKHCSYNGLLKKGELCSMQHKQVPL